jgi:hypothetical protein
MNALLHAGSHRTLLILVVATAAAFALRGNEAAGLVVGLSTLAIAWLKGRLVVLDFMELRHAPRLWRGLVEGWLLLVTALLIGFYALGAPAG